MARALSVDRVVRVGINLQPMAAARRNFGTLLIIGASGVIDMEERLRAYTGIDGVAADFGMDAPEYRAAELYFSQSPRPAQLCVGRWGKTPTPAILKGGILSDGEADASAWASVKDGSFAVSVGGVSKDITGLDFSGATNMNGVAAVVSAALASAGASCAWDGQRFAMKTSTLGASAGIGYLAPLSEPAGTDISAMLRMTASTGLPPVAGTDGETAKEAVAALADKSGDWYGCVFADEGLAVEDHLDVAAFVEASAKARIYGVTVTDSRALDAGYAEDAASKLKELARKRTIVAYSRNPYAIVSALGRAFTVNFSANRSTITLKFKQLPGVVAEGLTETQAQALEAKRCNVFAAYDNDTAIFQEGVMSGPAYFDEIHGLDWLQNAIQSETWNLLRRGRQPDHHLHRGRARRSREQRPCGSGHVERRRFRPAGTRRLSRQGLLRIHDPRGRTGAVRARAAQVPAHPDRRQACRGHPFRRRADRRQPLIEDGKPWDIRIAFSMCRLPSTGRAATSPSPETRPGSNRAASPSRPPASGAR